MRSASLVTGTETYSMQSIFLFCVKLISSSSAFCVIIKLNNILMELKWTDPVKI